MKKLKKSAAIKAAELKTVAAAKKNREEVAAAKAKKKQEEAAANSLFLDVLLKYTELLCSVYFIDDKLYKDKKTRAIARRQIVGLAAHLDSLGENYSSIALENEKQKAIFHANRFSVWDFAQAEYNETVPVIAPVPIPKDKDILVKGKIIYLGSPVRITYEPIRKSKTKTFQEELDSISALQLGQRFVSKRYQFNGMHANYLHSKMIVTETSETVKEIPLLDDEIVHVEIVEDPSTWIKSTQKNYLDIAGLVSKVNSRRNR